MLETCVCSRPASPGVAAVEQMQQHLHSLPSCFVGLPCALHADSVSRAAPHWHTTLNHANTHTLPQDIQPPTKAVQTGQAVLLEVALIAGFHAVRRAGCNRTGRAHLLNRAGRAPCLAAASCRRQKPLTPLLTFPPHPTSSALPSPRPHHRSYGRCTGSSRASTTCLSSRCARGSAQGCRDSTPLTASCDDAGGGGGGRGSTWVAVVVRVGVDLAHFLSSFAPAASHSAHYKQTTMQMQRQAMASRAAPLQQRRAAARTAPRSRMQMQCRAEISYVMVGGDSAGGDEQRQQSSS